MVSRSGYVLPERGQEGVTASAPRSARRTLALVVAVTALVYVAIVALTIQPYGDRLSSLVGASGRVAGRERAALGHGFVVFRSVGYDGLTYYLVAGDIASHHLAYSDSFRAQRIGYPFVVAIASLGRRAWRPAAMVGVNLLAVLAVAWLSGLILRECGGTTSVWWALACAVNPALIFGVQRDLAEPLMTALAVAALWLYLRRRLGWSVVALAAALLTREVAILFVVPLVAAELAARRIGRAIVVAFSVVPYLIWHLILQDVLGQAGIGAAAGQLVQPLAGIRAVAVAALHASLGHKLGWASVLAVVVFMGLSLVVALGAMIYRKRYDLFLGGMVTHSAAALCGASSIWLGFASAARVFGGIYPLTVYAFAGKRSRPLALLVGLSIALTLFTLLRFVVFNPFAAYYLTP